MKKSLRNREEVSSVVEFEVSILTEIIGNLDGSGRWSTLSLTSS